MRDHEPRAPANGAFRQDAWRIGAIAAAYFLAHDFAFFYPDSARILAALWPAGGIGLAALLLSPRRLWPAILAVLFAAGTAANLLHGRSLLSSLGFMTANALESLVSAWLIIRICGGNVTFTRMREVIVLIGAALFVNAGTALIGAATAELAASASLWGYWCTWWVADGLGVLLVTPLLVVWLRREDPPAIPRPGRMAEWVAFMAVWMTFSWLVFHQQLVPSLPLLRPYMLIALIAWPALRLGHRGVTLALIVLAGIAVTSASVTTGSWPWISQEAHERLLEVQVFLMCTTVAGFLLATSQSETKAAKRVAQEGHDHQLRTAATLNDNENRLQAMLDNSPTVVCIKDLQGRYLQINRRFETLFHLLASTVVGRTDHELFPEPLARAFADGDRRALAAKAQIETEEAIPQVDGCRTYLAVKFPLCGVDGTPYAVCSIASDITDRRRAETLLQQSEEKYRKLIEMTRTGFHILDNQGRVVDANAEYVRLSGHREIGDILGRNVLEWTAPHCREMNAGAVARCLRDGAIQGLELDYVDASGRITPVELFATLEGCGNSQRILSLCRDISERRRTEAERDTKQRLLSTILEGTPNPIYLKDRDSRILLANTSTAIAMGRPLTAIVGSRDCEIYDDPAIAEAMMRHDREVMASGVTETLEERVPGTHGDRFFLSTKTPFRDSDGSIAGVFGISQDITEFKLQQEELRLRALLLENVQDAMLCLDEQGVITYVNDATLKATGYDRGELIGRHVSMLNAPGDAAEATQRAQAVVRHGSATFNVTHVRKDGSVFPVEVFARSAVIQGRNCIIAVDRDISERIQTEDVLRRALQQAESANEAKSRFLATMSHEMRTPLNGVIGLTDLLRCSELTPGQAEMVRTIQDCGNSLLTVIGDVLDLAKIEAGNLELKPRDFSIRQLVAELEAMFAMTAQRKGLHLRVAVDAAVPDRVRGDAVRLRQVMLNLLGNALKFTERGEVALEVGLASAGPDGVVVAWVVGDTGPGIPAGYLANLFKPFTQADTLMSRKHGGTGLGLAIAKRLSDLMSGTLGVETVVGRGSRFRFAVPLAHGAGETSSATPSRGSVTAPAWSRPPAVLVVEDDPTSRFTIGLMLDELGCPYRMAEDGNQGIAAVATGTFDLVLMDCQMPECDGFTATRVLRERTVAGSRRLPIIALSANVFTDDRERCREAGMDDFLAKPCTLEALRICLVRWIGGKDGRAGP